MRIWRSHELGDPLDVLQLEEDDAPGEPGPSRSWSILPSDDLSDVLSCRGEYQVPTRCPTPGGEIAGVVSAVGRTSISRSARPSRCSVAAS